MKKEVLTELPDKIETRRMAEMGAKQRKIYESYLALHSNGVGRR